MPEITFFIDEHDLRLLVDRLNSDPEIAFIVPEDLPLNSQARQSRNSGFPLQVDGQQSLGKVEYPRLWKAVRKIDALADGLHNLWHVPAGPLPLIEVNRNTGFMPLMGPNERLAYPPIPDPWSGWTGTDQFGPGCPPWIRLELWTRHQSYTEQERTTLPELNSFWLNPDAMLIVSGVQWTGSRFRPAPAQTERWWKRMRA